MYGQQSGHRVAKGYEASEAAISGRLRALRTSRGLTQAQLAELAGTSQAVIQKIENGHSVRPRCIAGMAAVLGVNPAWLAWGEPYAIPSATKG